MARCDYCGKSSAAGGRRRHRRGVASHKFSQRAQRVKRVLKVNLHTARITINGVKKKMRLCTKCLRKLKIQNNFQNTQKTQRTRFKTPLIFDRQK